MAMTAPNKSSSPASPSQPANASMFNQPKAVWAIVFACIIAFMGLGLVDPILPEIAKQFHATAADVTLLFTSYNAVMAVAMLITGVLSSRLGIKNTLLLGIVVIALFSALGGMSNGVTALVLLRAGWGLGNAMFVATALSAIVSLSRTGVAKSIILFEVAVGLGISVGPLLGGELGSISWRGPFYGVACLMVLAFLFVVTLMPKAKKGEVAAHAKKASLLDPFRALKIRALRDFGIAAFLYNFGFFTLLVYAALVLSDLGLDTQGLGYVFLGWGLLLACTSVFMAPKLQKRSGTIKSMCIQLLLFAITLFVMAFYTHDKTVLICCVILAGAFLGNNNTLITTAVMNAADIPRPTASAAYSFLRFIGGAIAPYLAGKLAEWFNPEMPFIVGGACVVLSVLFLMFERKHLVHVDHAEAH